MEEGILDGLRMIVEGNAHKRETKLRYDQPFLVDLTTERGKMLRGATIGRAPGVVDLPETNHVVRFNAEHDSRFALPEAQMSRAAFRIGLTLPEGKIPGGELNIVSLTANNGVTLYYLDAEGQWDKSVYEKNPKNPVSTSSTDAHKALQRPGRQFSVGVTTTDGQIFFDCDNSKVTTLQGGRVDQQVTLTPRKGKSIFPEVNALNIARPPVSPIT